MYFSLIAAGPSLPRPILPTAPIKLRYDVGPHAAELSESSVKRGYIDIIVCGLQLTLSMSSLTSLTDLLEDEFMPVAVPMSVVVHSSDITLKVSLSLGAMESFILLDWCHHEH